MPFRPATSIAIAALVAFVAACNPIESWRSITGSNKNDPDPETTANTENLAAGEKQPYPNLATVPEPPVPTMTQSERDKLTESLVADRTNARYTEQKLVPGFASTGERPPPPGPAPPSGPASAGPPPPPPPPPPGGYAQSPPPGSPAATAPPDKAAAAPPLRKPGEPPEPGPKESSLQMPTIRATPQPDAPQPPPPPPRPVAAPAPAPSGSSLAPTTMASANPQPPPPPAMLPSPPPPPAAAMPTPAALEPKPAGRTAATIDFAAAKANFTQADRVAIDKVAAQFRQKPGMVHIVAYAAAGAAGREQLDSYRAALDRGQAVAKVLAEDGVPVGKIQTEAAPSRVNSPSGRVEILLAP